jgi:hypothetical protein
MRIEISPFTVLVKNLSQPATHALIQSKSHLPNHLEGISTSQYKISADTIVTSRVTTNDTPAAAG